MRFVAISDVHNQIAKVKIPDCDVLLIAGDLTGRGTISELSRFNHDLLEIKKRAKTIVCIAGNHDFGLQDMPEISKHVLSNVDHYLEDSFVIVNGVKIWGSPFSPRFFDWAFNADRGIAIKRHWDLIPNDSDIIITHGPVYGILDETVNGEHVGCQDLLDAVLRVRPKVHVAGHIHHAYGERHAHGMNFINASTCNEQYKPVNSPVVFDL